MDHIGLLCFLVAKGTETIMVTTRLFTSLLCAFMLSFMSAALPIRKISILISRYKYNGTNLLPPTSGFPYAFDHSNTNQYDCRECTHQYNRLESIYKSIDLSSVPAPIIKLVMSLTNCTLTFKLHDGMDCVFVWWIRRRTGEGGPQTHYHFTTTWTRIKL